MNQLISVVSTLTAWHLNGCDHCFSWAPPRAWFIYEIWFEKLFFVFCCGQSQGLRMNQLIPVVSTFTSVQLNLCSLWVNESSKHEAAHSHSISYMTKQLHCVDMISKACCSYSYMFTTCWISPIWGLMKLTVLSGQLVWQRGAQISDILLYIPISMT